MKYKILLLSAGRRVSFVERLQLAGYDVYSYEYDIECPIARICTVFKARKWTDPEWVYEVKHLMGMYKIDIVLPLSEDAIYHLSNSDIPGKVCVNPRASELCRDKIALEEFILGNEYLQQFYPVINGIYPIIAKPRHGYGSNGLIYIRDKVEARELNLNANDYVFQRVVKGKEYSIDVYYSRVNALIAAVPRIRERVGSGEVIDSTTDKSKMTAELHQFLTRFGHILKLTGPMCFQVIYDETDGKMYLIEINARFGGGCILSLESGVDMIGYIKNEYIHNQIESWYTHSWKDGLKMRRVNREFFFEG